jgi:hypothetical protein
MTRAEQVQQLKEAFKKRLEELQNDAVYISLNNRAKNEEEQRKAESNQGDQGNGKEDQR